MVGGCEGAVWSSDLPSSSFQALKCLLNATVSVLWCEVAESAYWGGNFVDQMSVCTEVSTGGGTLRIGTYQCREGLCHRVAHQQYGLGKPYRRVFAAHLQQKA
jgi:hypothetical protein